MAYIRKLIRKSNPNKWGYEIQCFPLGVTQDITHPKICKFARKSEAENEWNTLCRHTSDFDYVAVEIDEKYPMVIRVEEEDFFNDGNVMVYDANNAGNYYFIGKHFGAGNEANIMSAIKWIEESGFYVKSITSKKANAWGNPEDVTHKYMTMFNNKKGEVK